MEWKTVKIVSYFCSFEFYLISTISFFFLCFLIHFLASPPLLGQLRSKLLLGPQIQDPGFIVSVYTQVRFRLSLLCLPLVEEFATLLENRADDVEV